MREYKFPKKLKEIKHLFLGTKKKKMLKAIQSIFDSITSQQASVLGCNLTVQTSDGEQISINVEPVQPEPIQAWKSQFQAYQSQRREFLQFRCRKDKNNHHTVREVQPECAKYSASIFDVLKKLFETSSIQGIEEFLSDMFSYTKRIIHSRILMILILKLYETFYCSEHNPHPYFFVLKPLFQVNRKNLRNEYSEQITAFVQYIDSIQISAEPLVNLIFEFGKYVGKDVFFQTLHEIRNYRVTRSQISHIFNKKISMFIVEFFKNNPEINQRAISEFGEPINIW